jgi:type I restriction enzyme R subunit
MRAARCQALPVSSVTDIYAVAGIGRPDLSHLDEAFIERMRAQRNPSLAIEALRRVIEQEMRKVTRHNIVKQASFSERLADLMRRYTNQNLSAAEIIAKLVELAREVSADADRGSGFAPPLTMTSSPSTTRSPRTSPPSPRWATPSWPPSPATW